jgi:hypothetical protein
VLNGQLLCEGSEDGIERGPGPRRRVGQGPGELVGMLGRPISKATQTGPVDLETSTDLLDRVRQRGQGRLCVVVLEVDDHEQPCRFDDALEHPNRGVDLPGLDPRDGGRRHPGLRSEGTSRQAGPLPSLPEERCCEVVSHKG